MENNLTEPTNNKSKIRLIGTFIVLIFLIIIAGVVFKYYKKYQDRQAYYQEIKNRKAKEVSITIVEGVDLKKVVAKLVKDFGLSQKELLARFGKPKDFKSSLSIASLEGFIYPDTYRLLDPFNIEEFIKKTTTNFDKKWAEASSDVVLVDNKIIFKEFDGIKIDPYEALIMASIIEKEAGRDLSATKLDSERLQEERQMIAGIFYNRLGASMPFQSDATINYVTGKSDAAPLLVDLEKVSPYNTYTNLGFPPTPISNPSYSSIYAALHPIKSDYYFFLHKQPSGEIVYSKTFDEHVKNKNKWLK